jgi:hypothetical protein
MAGVALPASVAFALLDPFLERTDRRDPAIEARLCGLCERDLPVLNRHVLSRVMDWLGTPKALSANLALIDDGKPSPVPQGIRDQPETVTDARRRACRRSAAGGITRLWGSSCRRAPPQHWIAVSQGDLRAIDLRMTDIRGHRSDARHRPV